MMLSKASTPQSASIVTAKSSPSTFTPINNASATILASSTATITPPSSAMCSGSSSSAGSHSPNEHSLSFRPTSGDEIPMMLMMDGNLTEKKNWYASQNSNHTGPSSCGYPSPPFQEMGNGMQSMISMISPSSASTSSMGSTSSVLAATNLQGNDPTRLSGTDGSPPSSLAHHRTSSTPNIHYSFMPDLSNLTSSTTATSASNPYLHHNHQQYSQSSTSGTYPRQFAYYHLPQQQQQHAGYGATAQTTSRSPYVQTLASTGYNPVTYTHEQQAQYLYALYHQQQQFQSQVKDDQSQRLMMYASGFPQDSLMYYSGGSSGTNTATTNNRQGAQNGSNSSNNLGSSGSHSSIVSSPQTSSGTRGSPIIPATSPSSFRDDSAMEVTTGHLHLHQHQPFNQSHLHHQFNQHHHSEASSNTTSSSSSGISTPPNSGSMSFTSSPSTQPLKEVMDVTGHSSATLGLPTSTLGSTPSSASSFYSTYALGMFGSGGNNGTNTGATTTTQQLMGGSHAHQMYHNHSSGYAHHPYSLASGYMASNTTGSTGNHTSHFHPYSSASSSNISSGGVGGSINGNVPSTIKICSNCGCTSTPSWRRCPTGKQLLCNACGLYQKLHNKPRPFCVLDDGSVKVQRNAFLEATRCGHCHTTETPLWRRGSNGQSLCNACGLYFKQHRQYRPSLPNTGWLSTGGYDAEMITGSGISSGGSWMVPNNVSTTNSSAVGGMISSSSSSPNAMGNCSLSTTNYSTTSVDEDGNGENHLIMESDTSNTNIGTQFHYHHHHHQYQRHQDGTGKGSSIESGIGGTISGQPQLSNTHHSIIMPSHTMSPEDEAAVSALAEQMLDAQELFTREEDPGVLAAVAAAAKMHFEQHLDSEDFNEPTAC